MPTMWAHSHYWSNAAPSTVADPPPPIGGYPSWQAAIFGSGFGALQPVYERLTRSEKDKE